jgi:hypothetical protein
MLKKISAFVIALGFYLNTYAQNEPVEMADVMRSNGKIYVVVAVVALIMGGILAYLIVLDRKITKLEKENK